MAAGLALAAAENQVLAEADFCGDFRKRRILDQRRTQPAQVTFRRERMGTKNHFGNDEIEDGVAEELESFVAGARSAAVRQRLLEQSGIVEYVAQRFLQPGLGLGQH